MLAIILLFSAPAWAEDDGIVRVRTDGRIIDANGKIIAVPNKADNRNTEEKKYYSYLNASGKPNGFSDFYLINDRWFGLKKIPLNSNSPVYSNKNTPVNASQQNGMVTNYNQGNTSVTLKKSPEIPIYDSIENKSAY